MSGPRTTGWHQMMGASQALAEAEVKHGKKSISDSELLNSLANAVRQYGGGTRDNFQQLYERMERLHQKIDRIEATIGSAPRK